jgi:two-component system nitrate/nitrite response regulator NarL
MDIRRILLVDDNPTVQRSFKTALSLKSSWEIVAEALNGARGLALFRKLAPNVVIVDYHMPDMTGVELGRQLRAIGFTELLILFSLHAGKELNTIAQQVGFDAVLPKNTPFPIVTIIEKMKGEMSKTRVATT